MEMHSMFKPHPRVTADPVGPSRTKQSFAEESEINVIVARYQKHGIIDHVAKYGGMYGDMPGPDDFHQAMNMVTEAKSMFEELPSNVRSRFENDPAAFLEFVGNEENHDEMVEMGLLAKRPEAPADPAEGDPPAEPVGDPAEPAAPVAASGDPEGTLAQ